MSQREPLSCHRHARPQQQQPLRSHDDEAEDAGKHDDCHHRDCHSSDAVAADARRDARTAAAAAVASALLQQALDRHWVPRRLMSKKPSLSSMDPPSGPVSPRSLGPPIPSPLSQSSHATSPASTSPRDAVFSVRRQSCAFTPQPSAEGNMLAVESAGQTSFPRPLSHSTLYDKGGKSSIRPNTNIAILPRDANNILKAAIAKEPSFKGPPSPVSLSPSSPKLPMAVSMATARAEVSEGLPRTSSIDSAISAISSAPSTHKSSSRQTQPAPDMDALIRTAGSPEALIQNLLKEKQSQSYQNSQLWRIVDKQRAMILGLNKDLESALKEKEKYRRKFKEMMSISTRSEAAAAHQTEGADKPKPAPRDAGAAEAQPTRAADSPGLDSDSQKDSPIDMTTAHYPITPPADRLPALQLNMAELLQQAKPPNADPRTGLPRSPGIEVIRDPSERSKMGRTPSSPRDPAPLVLLPQPRSPPGEPPKMPAPSPPATAPSATPASPVPRSVEHPASFSTPPRKPPPAPLRLSPHLWREAAFADENDTESEYDDILELESTGDEKRGRRATPPEDNERDATASLDGSRPSEELPFGTDGQPDVSTAATAQLPLKKQKAPPSEQANEPDPVAESLVDLDGKSNKIATTQRPPDLPVSSRLLRAGSQSAVSSALSSLSPSAQAGPPLSPRPPLQPFPPASANSLLPTSLRSSRSASHLQSRNAVFPSFSTKQHPESGATSTAAPERTKIFRGLVMDEYPDLLLPPNALPSVAVKVASSRMKPSRASLLSLTQLEEDPVFTLAITSRADSDELWRVEKDMASLFRLDQRLKQHATVIAKTPERSLFSGHAPAKLDARRIALEQYMDELLDTATATAIELCRWLSTNPLPPNADDSVLLLKRSSGNSSGPTGSDGQVGRSGYLTKKGKNFGGWKARFFVVDGPLLKYYEAPGGAHLGNIKLRNAQIARQSQSSELQSPAGASSGEEIDNQYRHAFLVLEPKKKDSSSHVKHVLCAESDKERDLWVDALSQWIEQRELRDGGFRDARTEAPRAPTLAHSHGTGSKSAAKPYPARSQDSTPDAEKLTGVKYDSTNAGDVPYGAPGGPPPASSSPEHAHASPLANEGSVAGQTSRIISGPKDPCLISDSTAWGNKSNASVPTMERKQRKRSFFGFGPKMRSLSDGQDSAFGGSEPGSVTTSHAATHHEPTGQLFGAPLAEAVRCHRPSDVKVPLPSVVYRCIQFLDSKDATLEEGIFRLSGSNMVIRQLRERFNAEGDVNLMTDDQCYDMHAVASLLKLYLRELPTTILTRDLHIGFLAVTEVQEREDKIAAMRELAQKLPPANATLLKYLISFLIRIINNADVNKMTARNVGIVFSPTLNIPNPVFAMFLQHYESIFGVDPEQFQLPSPTVTDDAPSQQDFREVPRRIRPSTSQGSASPQSSAWTEPRRDTAARMMTPTPPLTVNVPAGGEMTPPPPQQQQQQQQTGTSRLQSTGPYSGPGNLALNPAPRTAVEGGPISPGFFESPDANSTALRSAPLSDRAAYYGGHDEAVCGLSPEQPNMPKPRRRDSWNYISSKIYLQPQGSRSRLREEAKF